MAGEHSSSTPWGNWRWREFLPMRTDHHGYRPIAVTRRIGSWKRSLGRNSTVFAYLLNTPSMFIIALLVAYPIGYSLWVSLHRYDLRRPRIFRFIGLQNYLDVIADPAFGSALRVTVIFTLTAVTAIVLLGLAVALLLNRPFPGCGFVRAISIGAMGYPACREWPDVAMDLRSQDWRAECPVEMGRVDRSLPGLAGCALLCPRRPDRGSYLERVRACRNHLPRGAAARTG